MNGILLVFPLAQVNYIRLIYTFR